MISIPNWSNPPGRLPVCDIELEHAVSFYPQLVSHDPLKLMKRLVAHFLPIQRAYHDIMLWFSSRMMVMKVIMS